MSYDVIALDIDGTLTNSKKEITERTRHALIEAQKRGKKVILASGRHNSAMQRYANELELAGWFVAHLPAGHRVRVLKDFAKDAVFFDIETDGMTPTAGLNVPVPERISSALPSSLTDATFTFSP